MADCLTWLQKAGFEPEQTFGAKDGRPELFPGALRIEIDWPSSRRALQPAISSGIRLT